MMVDIKRRCVNMIFDFVPLMLWDQTKRYHRCCHRTNWINSYGWGSIGWLHDLEIKHYHRTARKWKTEKRANGARSSKGAPPNDWFVRRQWMNLGFWRYISEYCNQSSNAFKLRVFWDEANVCCFVVVRRPYFRSRMWTRFKLEMWCRENLHDLICNFYHFSSHYIFSCQVIRSITS